MLVLLKNNVWEKATRKRSSRHPILERHTDEIMGLKKINTIGIQQANKVMHMSAIAYNISTSSVQA